jgi:hypothetical protein
MCVRFFFFLLLLFDQRTKARDSVCSTLGCLVGNSWFFFKLLSTGCSLADPDGSLNLLKVIRPFTFFLYFVYYLFCRTVNNVSLICSHRKANKTLERIYCRSRETSSGMQWQYVYTYLLPADCGMGTIQINDDKDEGHVLVKNDESRLDEQYPSLVPVGLVFHKNEVFVILVKWPIYPCADNSGFFYDGGKTVLMSLKGILNVTSHSMILSTIMIPCFKINLHDYSVTMSYKFWQITHLW